LIAATKSFQDPPGFTNCGENTCAKGDGFCYKVCYEEGFVRGGQCIRYTHKDEICCCAKNELSTPSPAPN
jgi:hypothetical protein